MVLVGFEGGKVALDVDVGTEVGVGVFFEGGVKFEGVVDFLVVVEEGGSVCGDVFFVAEGAATGVLVRVEGNVLFFVGCGGYDAIKVFFEVFLGVFALVHDVFEKRFDLLIGFAD